MSRPKTLLLFIILFTAMFLFGFIENIKAVSYPLIKTEFNISYESQGVMVSVMSISYVIFCLLGGILIGRLGVKKPFILGIFLMLAGLAGVFILPRFILVAMALFFVSAAFGLFEVSVNALGTQVFTTKTALFFNLMHFFYGAGSALSPLAAGRIATVLDWRYVYLFSLPLVLIFFVPSIVTRFPQAEETGTGKSTTKRTSFFVALKTPMVWVFSLTLGIMIAVELCSGNWAGLYFQDVYQLDPKTSGASFVSNFYILFTLSRLLGGFAIEKIGYMRSLFIATLASIATLCLGFIFGARGIYILPALGLFTAMFWPTLLATAAGYFRSDAPVMTSAIIVIAGAINSGIQFIMGLTNRVVGPAWGYRSALLYAVLIAISLIVLARCQRRPYSAGENSE